MVFKPASEWYASGPPTGVVSAAPVTPAIPSRLDVARGLTGNSPCEEDGGKGVENEVPTRGKVARGYPPGSAPAGVPLPPGSRSGRGGPRPRGLPGGSLPCLLAPVRARVAGYPA